MTNSDSHAHDPRSEIDRLASSTTPFLIGVRHHSPALAAAMDELLEVACPEVLFVELAHEFGPWIPYLVDPNTTAPIALAAATENGELVFAPFADFSPELAALRWAHRNNVPVVAGDLPIGARGERDAGVTVASSVGTSVDAAIATGLRAVATGPDDDVWDRLIETMAPGGTAEQLRRAALAIGWSNRVGKGIDPYTVRREQWMRARLREQEGKRVAAVVGSYHGLALLDGAEGSQPDLEEDEGRPERAAAQLGPVTTSLVPYTFALIDSRSGYPSGIRDPQWQQRVFEASNSTAAIEQQVIVFAVRICEQLRNAGHPAGPGEAQEIVRVAQDLSQLRGLPCPGRAELVEAIGTVLGHGEPLGRSRALAQAMESVLVGDHRGQLAAGTPRSGLAPAVEELLRELRLPVQRSGRKTFRLDVHRSSLDNRRHVTLARMELASLDYGTRESTQGIGGADSLTCRWAVEWTPATVAKIEVAGALGVSLEQVCEGVLRRRHRQGMIDQPAATALRDVEAAAECELALAQEYLDELANALASNGTLAQLRDGINLLRMLGSNTQVTVKDSVLESVTASAVASLDGMDGSTELVEIRAIVDLALAAGHMPGGIAIAASLGRLSREGNTLVSGAARAAQVLLGLKTIESLGVFLAGFIDGATTTSSRRRLSDTLRGTLTAASELLSEQALDPLVKSIDALDDDAFASRLPCLRSGFDAMTAAARERLLRSVDARQQLGRVDPSQLARWVAADRRAARAMGLEDGDYGISRAVTTEYEEQNIIRLDDVPKNQVDRRTRWALILGQPQEAGGLAQTMGWALDRLYGRGHGEGSLLGASPGRSRPTIREWLTELDTLFGSDVRTEVLAAAGAAGDFEAILNLDPAAVQPSVELLRTALAMVGSLPEVKLAVLRPLIGHVVDQLTAALATQMRPALTGLAIPRPTRRPTGRLDMDRTIRANLATAHRTDAGNLTIFPEHPVFQARGRREVDWRLILAVDVSGSMESSVIWSAIMSAIMAGVPAMTTHFVAFSHEVIDFSDRVDDPLRLLLDVSVGGGTNIGGALAYARSLVTVPSRTLVVTVSDFEEGTSVGQLMAQARALRDDGVTMLGVAALDDRGIPRYSTSITGQLAASGMPVAALSPTELAHWVADQIRGTS